MTLTVNHQETYSRSELLLRFFFGSIYILLPHVFLLFFVSLWGSILSFIALLIILFTSQYPKSIFEFQEQLMRWKLRVNARLMNLADDYPSFGLTATDNYITLEVPYPEKTSRGLTLLRLFFGFIYVLAPHFFILFFRTLWGAILLILAWFSVLFTAKFPKSWHSFLVENYRWQYRVFLYMSFMTDEYPPFSGKE